MLCLTCRCISPRCELEEEPSLLLDVALRRREGNDCEELVSVVWTLTEFCLDALGIEA